MATVTQSNPTAFRTLTLALEALETKEVKVGWFESAKYEDGTPVAYVAAINELGPHARPFVTPTVEQKASEWFDIAARGAQAVMRGDATAEDVMKAIGIQATSDIKDAIANVYSPPLSDITLAARKYREDGKKVTGSTIGKLAKEVAAGTAELSTNTKPLIESKLMIRSTTYVVEDSQ